MQSKDDWTIYKDYEYLIIKTQYGDFNISSNLSFTDEEVEQEKKDLLNKLLSENRNILEKFHVISTDKTHRLLVLFDGGTDEEF